VKFRYFHYLDPINGGVIRICSKKKPSEHTAPKGGTWIVTEFVEDNFEMPCFPQILWSTLKTMIYLGCVEKEDES